MNAKEKYKFIIKKAKLEMSQNLRPKTKNQYIKDFRPKKLFFEFHHILPKSLFPKWEKKQSNIVALTPEEHRTCHKLLIEIFPSYEMYMSAHFFKVLNEEEEIVYKQFQSEHGKKCARLIWDNKELREKNLSSRKDYYKNWTKEEQEAFKKVHSEAQKKYRNSMTKEEKQNLSKKMSDSKKKQYASENGELIKEKMHLAKQNMTKEDWDIVIKKRKQTMNNWSEEEQEIYHKKMVERRKKQEENRSNEDKQKMIEKIKETVKNRTDEEKKQFSENCSKGQQKRFAITTPLYRKLKKDGFVKRINDLFTILKGINIYNYTESELYKIVVEKIQSENKK